MERVGQEQASEARESSGGPGRGPLQLLASLLFTGANAMSLPYPSLDVVRSEEIERHFTFSGRRVLLTNKGGHLCKPGDSNSTASLPVC